MACVIRNRAENPGWWGREIKSVCTARQQLRFWFDKQAKRVRFVDELDAELVQCLDIADRVMNQPLRIRRAAPTTTMQSMSCRQNRP